MVGRLAPWIPIPAQRMANNSLGHVMEDEASRATAAKPHNDSCLCTGNDVAIV